MVGETDQINPFKCKRRLRMARYGLVQSVPFLRGGTSDSLLSACQSGPVPFVHCQKSGFGQALMILMVTPWEATTRCHFPAQAMQPVEKPLQKIS